MKLKWNIPENITLADFATEITIHHARTHAMASERRISDEHVTTNQAVRKTLLSRGITPEALPRQECRSTTDSNEKEGVDSSGVRTT